MSGIAFVDFEAQKSRLLEKIEERCKRVIQHGAFILGPEVTELEDTLSERLGGAHCISCGNGTDAITLALMAEGIGVGDVVLCPAFSFAATAEAPAQLGIRLVFVDVDERTFNIDPIDLEAKIFQARNAGFSPKAVISVDLFGQPADYNALRKIADRESLLLIADAAQGFGAEFCGRKVGTLADYTTTSFFPSKPLGCFGDGGAVFTLSDERAEVLRSLRVHGKGEDKYQNIRIGLNSRLDTIQAAVLLCKLSIFDEEVDQRQRVAYSYNTCIQKIDKIVHPEIDIRSRSVWANYTIQLPNRDEMARRLQAAGIPTAIYYPTPLHRQLAYQNITAIPALAPTADALCRSVLSLPMHPYLTDDNIQYVASVLAGTF